METTLSEGTPLTLGDLCAAIGDGRLPYTIHSDQFEVRYADARHLQRDRLNAAVHETGRLASDDHSQADASAWFSASQSA